MTGSGRRMEVLLARTFKPIEHASERRSLFRCLRTEDVNLEKGNGYRLSLSIEPLLTSLRYALVVS